MVITPRQMRRAYDHQPTDIAVRGDVAHLALASWAQKPLALQFRVTHAKARRGSVRQAGGEAHHHEVRGRVRVRTNPGTQGPWHGALSWRWNELEEEIFKVPFVHGDTKLACLGGKVLSIAFQSRDTYRLFSRTDRDRFSSQQQWPLSKFGFCS